MNSNKHLNKSRTKYIKFIRPYINEKTIPEATKEKIFAFLDANAAQGKDVPPIRIIAGEVHASSIHVGPAVKLWRERQAAAEAQEVKILSAQVFDQALTKTVDEALTSIRTAVADALKGTLQKYEDIDKKRASEAAAREEALRNRALEAEIKMDEYFRDKILLGKELETETAARKKAESEREAAREARNNAEAELAEIKEAFAAERKQMQAEIQRLEDLLKGGNQTLL